MGSETKEEFGEKFAFTVPDDQTDPIKVAYGIAWHETYVMVTIE